MSLRGLECVAERAWWAPAVPSAADGISWRSAVISIQVAQTTNGDSSRPNNQFGRDGLIAWVRPAASDPIYDLEPLPNPVCVCVSCRCCCCCCSGWRSGFARCACVPDNPDGEILLGLPPPSIAKLLPFLAVLVSLIAIDDAEALDKDPAPGPGPGVDREADPTSLFLDGFSPSARAGLPL